MAALEGNTSRLKDSSYQNKRQIHLLFHVKQKTGRAYPLPVFPFLNVSLADQPQPDVKRRRTCREAAA